MATDDDNALIQERRTKLQALRAQGVAFPNDFRRQHETEDLHQQYGNLDEATLFAREIAVAIAGRLMLKRVMGKASFATLQDGVGRIQIFLQRDTLGDEVYQSFKQWDLGDIFAVQAGIPEAEIAKIQSQFILV